jgi:hypothetical protein
MAAVEPIWCDYACIGLRIQQGAEVRTQTGDMLRPSCEWIDGRKTRRKLVGTAAFYISGLSLDRAKVTEILAAMDAHGYRLWSDSRLVVIGGDGAWGDDMPERFASAIINARLVTVIADGSAATAHARR